MTESEKRIGSPWLWFGLFLVAMIGMGLFVKTSGIDNELHATGLMLLPALLLIPMARRSIAKASARGATGAAHRRYILRMGLVSIAYLASLFLAAQLIDEGDPITPLSVVLAVIPGLAVAGYFWAIGRLIVEQGDEFLRMLVVRQCLIGTGIALSAAGAWGFLESFDQVPHLDAFWWPVVFFFGFGLGGAINYSRYGTTGECS